MNQQSPLEKVKSPLTGYNNAFRELIPDTDKYSYWDTQTGYMSTDYLVAGSDAVDVAEATQPQIVKALRVIDQERNLVWYPSIIDIPSRGMVFPDGTSTDNWGWFYAPYVEILPEEQQDYPNPNQPGTFYTHRLAIDQGQLFDRNSFIEACKALGLVITTEQ